MRKNLLVIITILAVIFFTSCTGFVDYRVRLVSTNKVLIIDRVKVSLLYVGDTVQIEKIGAGSDYEIDLNSSNFCDTFYVFSYYDSDSSLHVCSVDKKIGIIEGISD